MIRIDFTKEKGPIKPMHAVGQPPFQGGFRSFDFSPIHYLQDAAIPYARLHDVNGAFGGNRFVDIPNLFRDFDADENDPASYDFTFTDLLLKALHDYGVEPIFRLGTTIENQAVIKSYRIDPPKDFHKWARICEHVVRHYNEGWADGFHYGITYWEIWNEPETSEYPQFNEMWTGTPEQYYELYDITAKHLKKCFGDSIKVGGYAATSFRAIFYEPELYDMDLPRLPMDRAYHVARIRMDFFQGFMKYISAHSSPLDFFSWHSYVDTEMTRAYARFLHKALRKYGYDKTETQLNEWNNAFSLSYIGTSYASAQAAAMMLSQQEEETAILCYYDARIGYSAYAGLFDCMTRKPVSTYYALMAFGELYRLGTQVELELDGEEEGLYAVAAKAKNGEKKALMLANCGRDREIRLPGMIGWSTYLVEEGADLAPVTITANRFVLKENQVLLLTNYVR